MSTSSHFHILKGAKFAEELLTSINAEIDINKKIVKDFFVSEDTILINFNHQGFETLFVTTNYEKTYFKIKFPDESLYSGFKYRDGESNVFACKIMLLLKYYLKEKIIVSSDCMRDYFSEDFEKALEYLNKKGYSMTANLREYSNTPLFFINNEKVNNIYDESGDIFNSMFKIATFD